MSAVAPWSVKGIDPKAREVAKDLARRSGMTLGEWLNRVILEDDLPEDVTAETQFADRTHRASQGPPKLSAVPTSPDMARIAFALDRVTDRIEASETRTGLAINGVEHSVRLALARIETAEREQHAAASRLEGLLAETTDQQAHLSDRLRRFETEGAGPRSPEVLRALEGRGAGPEPQALSNDILQRLGDRLALAEARTAAALEDFKGSLSALDRRLGSMERRGDQNVDEKFERLGEALTQRVEAVRAEVVQKLEAAVGPGMESRLAAMAETVRAAEIRSSKAVEEIGRQVLSMAEAVGRKLNDVDQRGAEAIDQVGSEVARIAGAVELRLARSEHAQAEAFERLGAELGRVTEALAERPLAPERPPAAALQDVEDDMSRFGAAMDAALPDRSDPEQAAQAEDPAPTFEAEQPSHSLEPAPQFAPEAEAEAGPAAEAHSTIEPESLRELEAAIQAAWESDTDQQSSGLEPDLRLAPDSENEPESGLEPGAAAQFEADAEAEAEADSETRSASPILEPDLQTEALLEEARQRLGPPPEPEPEAIAAYGDGAPYGAELFSRAETEVEGETKAEDDLAADANPTHDELSETVEAPWRRLDFDAAGGDIPETFAPITESEDEDLFAPVEPQLSTREVIDRARAAARAEAVKPVEMQAKISGRAATGRLFNGFGAKPPARRQNSALQTALMVAGGAAFLSVGAAGLTLMQDSAVEPRKAELSPPDAKPRAAVALSPALSSSSPSSLSTAAPVFAQVRAAVEAGTPGAVAQLKALADSGHPQAQLYLAELYDLGEAGLTQDPQEARRLIGLAAENGEPHAMHNLGVFYFRGEGGTQDLASAAQWFRKAAAAGVVESQYNLGLLYQSGSGVTRDLDQARHWFGAAAAQGDAEAARALANLNRQPAALAAGQPKTAPSAAQPAQGAAASASVRQTQLMLARLGYFEGPADGLSSPSFRTALAAYQRDQADHRAGPRPQAAKR